MRLLDLVGVDVQKRQKMKQILFSLLAYFILARGRVLLDSMNEGLMNYEEDDSFAQLQMCNSDVDCQEDECCNIDRLLSFCYAKPKKNQPCSIKSTCDCAPELVCKLYRDFGNSDKFYRCTNKAANDTNV